MLLHQRLDQAVDRLRPRERHLDVDLRELELAIGALILVAEAADDLEVAIGAGDHQDLLEDLRRLRQRVELARMHAARHQEVARAFGRRLRQNRRLDLPEAVRVEIAAASPSPRGGAGRCCAAAAAGADRGSGSAAARPPTPASLRRSGTAASSPRSGCRISRASTSTSPVASFGLTVSSDRRCTDAGDADRRTPSRSRLATAISASFSRTTTCDMPARSRMSMKVTPPRSRTRCTQPSSTTSAPTSSGAQCAAGVGSSQIA